MIALVTLLADPMWAIGHSNGREAEPLDFFGGPEVGAAGERGFFFEGQVGDVWHAGCFLGVLAGVAKRRSDRRQRTLLIRVTMRSPITAEMIEIGNANA